MLALWISLLSVSCALVPAARNDDPPLQLDYSDLEAMGAACAGRDSCHNLTDPSDFYSRNCECDFLCGAYGDCCIDAPAARRRPFRTRQRRCVAFGREPYVGAYVITGCPSQTSPELAAACARPDPADPLRAVPVTVPRGATFLNEHCALCNGAADTGDLERWGLLLDCNTLWPHGPTQEYVWDNIERRNDTWGVEHAGVFHPCDIRFDKPESVRSVRLCRADVVSECPADYARDVVRQMCGSYTAVVLSKEEGYRNPHCALCNGERAGDTLCSLDQFIGRDNKRKRFNLALLLDVHRGGGEEVGETRRVTCKGKQKYDPFHKKCRRVVCGFDGYELVGDRCQKIAD